ncbi:hypothetical protein [Aestuariivirga sp.]|uniref:hypothetical protein n=1 Tax=Aestuariivirga sp. TaxID=2650926 RepID=UPI003594568B
MKKIALGLFALATLSTAALAADRTDIDPRDRQQWNGSTMVQTEVAPFAVKQNIHSPARLTAYERSRLQAEANENNSK